MLIVAVVISNKRREDWTKTLGNRNSNHVSYYLYSFSPINFTPLVFDGETKKKVIDWYSIDLSHENSQLAIEKQLRKVNKMIFYEIIKEISIWDENLFKYVNENYKKTCGMWVIVKNKNKINLIDKLKLKVLKPWDKNSVLWGSEWNMRMKYKCRLNV